jgi:uncharacterized protein YfaS (alpha-2-macroglobulin family)
MLLFSFVLLLLINGLQAWTNASAPGGTGNEDRRHLSAPARKAHDRAAWVRRQGGV